MSTKPKPSKYKNVRTVVDGIKFQSKREANRYRELKLLHRAEKISRLAMQVPYECRVNGILICKYVADFVYFDLYEKSVIIEDVKGMRTDVYKLKKKLVEAIHGVKIREV